MRVHQFSFAALTSVLLAGTALTQTAATATTELNIRSGPGPMHEVVGVIPSGGSVTLSGCLDDGSWCQVDSAGTVGWASGGYLSVAAAASEPVIVAEQRTEVSVPVVTYEEDQSGEGAFVGMASGAATGALVGGPIGAAIGGAAGGLIGGLSNLPEPVTTYVRANKTETVYLDGEVVPGATLPETVAITPVPDSEYGYVYVNGVPAVVSPDTRQVVHIVR